MTHNRLGKDGFTIVEVMIVLAVAGLIFVIVFLAVPDLMRASRNNQRKQDVQSVLEAVSHYELNNSANFPTTADPNYSQFTGLLDHSTLSWYENANIQTQAGNGTTPGVTYNNGTNGNQITLVNYAKCDPNNPGSAFNTGASYTDVVAMYSVEAAHGTTPQCEQL